MKVYNLRCAEGHRFEGWFSSEDDFSVQQEQRRIACPLCESKAITKLPSAPRLNISGAGEPACDGKTEAQARIIEFARRLIANTEDVGERFAEEARRIHFNEAPERSIRGVASEAERAALAEEGIDVISLPLPAALKQPLQ